MIPAYRISGLNPSLTAINNSLVNLIDLKLDIYKLKFFVLLSLNKWLFLALDAYSKNLGSFKYMKIKKIFLISTLVVGFNSASIAGTYYFGAGSGPSDVNTTVGVGTASLDETDVGYKWKTVIGSPAFRS